MRSLVIGLIVFNASATHAWACAPASFVDAAGDRSLARSRILDEAEASDRALRNSVPSNLHGSPVRRSVEIDETTPSPTFQIEPLVFILRDGRSGEATLRARTADWIHRRRPLRVEVQAIYRFDADADVWRHEQGAMPAWTVPVPKPAPIQSADMDLVLHTFPPVGLFWVIWEEDGRRFSSVAYAGPVLCNDVMIGPAPPGRVAMCVPFPDHAGARFVPEPAGLPE